jgi:ribosome-associated translation inhibitor RaiA
VQVPLQVTFRSMAHSDALATHVEQRAARLEHIFDPIISCHVVIELAGHHHSSGHRYRASINLCLPGHEIVTSHGPAVDDIEDARATANRAFDEAERRLEDWVQRRRGTRRDEARRST